MDFAAEAVVPASPQEVFAFLADLEHHWQLTGCRVQVIDLNGPPGARNGGTVRIRGPLGLGRTARTRVLWADEPRSMEGSAEIGNGTTAAVSWTIAPGGEGSHVRLEATIERVSPFDRLMLALGGRKVMQRVFSRAVVNLAARFAGTP